MGLLEGRRGSHLQGLYRLKGLPRIAHGSKPMIQISLVNFIHLGAISEWGPVGALVQFGIQKWQYI